MRDISISIIQKKMMKFQEANMAKMQEAQQKQRAPLLEWPGLPQRPHDDHEGERGHHHAQRGGQVGAQSGCGNARHHERRAPQR